MLKKITLIGISLIAILIFLKDDMNTFLNSSLLASSNTKIALKDTQGRVNLAPSGISGSTIGLRKGDRFYTETKNPLTNDLISWTLINKEQYTDYGCDEIYTVCSNPSITGWYSMADQKIDYLNPGFEKSDYKLESTSLIEIAPYVNSAHYARIKSFQTDMNNNPIDSRIMTYRNQSILHTLVVSDYPDKGQKAFMKDGGFVDASIKGPYLPMMYSSLGHAGAGIAEIIPAKDRMFSDDYWVPTSSNDGSWRIYTTNFFYANGSVPAGAMGLDTNFGLASSGVKKAVRPSIYFNVDNIVFGLASGTAGNGDISSYTLPSDYTNLYTSGSKPMKIRVYNPEDPLAVTFDKVTYQDGTDLINKEVGQGDILQFHADATNNKGSTVSLLMFKDDTFVKYIPLEAAKGQNGIYEFDTIDIAEGTYKVALVNEIYDESDMAPEYSSLLSDTKEIRIKKNSPVVFNSTPGASLAYYEYSKNTSTTDTLGHITGNGSMATDTFKIIAKPAVDAAHLDDYMKFKLAMDGTTISPSENLNAKEYFFRIQGYDANDNPIDRAFQDVTISVRKTTPTLNFSDATNQSVKIGDVDVSGTVTTNNTDTLTNNEIMFTLTGGISNVLSVSTDTVNPLQYNLAVIASHSGSGLPADYTLTASLKETSNFNAVTTTVRKTINVYNELSDLIWSPSKGSFSATDVTTGKTIGTLLAVDGFGPFTYEVVKTADDNYDSILGADNASFSVSNTAVAKGIKVDVKTSSSLTPKTYAIQFKVTDSQGASFYKTCTIKVDAVGQASLEFKDRENGNIITTSGKKVKFNDINSKLLAEGGSTANAIEYDFAPSDMQPSGVNASSYATIDSSSGLITPIRTGMIKVQAKRPGDNTYGDIIAYMDLTIEPAEQIVTFHDINAVVNIQESKSKLVDAKGTIKSTGATGKGAITYQSSDTSIATVDTSGNVTGISIGVITLTATLNDPNEANYNSNYDTVTAIKSIKIYKGMSVTWSAVSPKLKANANAIGNKAGTLTVTDNASDPSFAISSNSTVENADASFFKVVDNGTTADVQLAKTISASDWESHGGSFKVQVDATDSNGTQTIDVVITLDEADNDAYFTEGGSKITALTKTYGENGNAFTLTSKTDGTGTTYSVVSDPNGVLTILGTGAVTINKAGSATVQVLAGAGNGYTQKAVSMVVTIEPGDQSITFKDTATLNRPFTKDTTFKEIAELKETSLDTVSSRNITYTSNDTAVCDIDSITGIVTMKTTGNCDITASNSDANWIEITTNKVINLYDGMGVSFTQTPSLQAEVTSTNAGASAGSLSVSGGIDPKTYAISTVTGAKNRDAAKFQVNSSGIVSFKTSIMASDLVGKYNTTKKIYEYYVQIETTDSLNTKVTTDAIVEIKGAPLKASFDTKGTGKITEVYGAGKTFTLDLSSNKGGGTPIYQLKNDANMPSDVLQSVDASGLVTILHANDKTFVGNPLKVEAIIPPSNGYDGETIETEVDITQATQPDFAFVTPNIKLGYGASITPTFSGQLAKGTISMTSGNNALATINGNDIKAKTTDGTVTITAVESGDRDYQSAVATATITIDSAPSYSLIINVPSATYGDTGISATATAVGSIGTNPVLTWSSSDSSIADIDASGNITIKKAGSVTITCSRTTTGEPSVTATAILVVDPKPIRVTIDNASKYVGEEVPTFHATIPTSDLVGSDTIGQAVFSCKDGSALVNANTKAGKYDINATYPTGSNPNYAITITKGELTIKQDTSQADWYHLEGATSNATLNPNDWYKEDVKVVLDNAIESAGTYDEISLDNTLWDTTVLVNDEGENNKDISFRIKNSGIVSTSQTTTIRIDKTNPVVKSITGTQTNKDAISQLINKLTFGTFFKPGTKVSIQSEDILPTPTAKISGVKEVSYNVYEIDRKTGIMNSTPVDTGTDIPNSNGNIEVKIDNVGSYRVCAIAKDNAGNVSSESCSDVNIKNIDVDIDNDGENEFQDPDTDGCPDINIPLQDEKGDIYKINVDRDGDGIPDLNIDSDGDGIAEINVDSDDDGKPDLNLVVLTKWESTFCAKEQIDYEGKPIEYCTMKDIKAVINVDTGKDGIPDIDIDFGGDFKADFNITKDGKTPSINIGIIHKWEPNEDFIINDFTYDTMKIDKHEILTNIDTDKDGKPDLNIDFDDDGKPDINVDTDGDWIPNIKIDGNGDGEADINLDINKDGIPDENIVDIKEWKPDLDDDKDGFLFDTMQGLQGKDEIEDNNVVIKKPDGGIFLPNFSLKVNNITETVEEKFKNDILKNEDGKIIAAVYDVKLMKDQTQVQPDGKLQIKIPLPQGIKNPYLVIEQADGTLAKVDVKIQDGYLIYESDYLGKICVLGDKVTEELPNINNPNLPNTSVKGTYTGGMGGAGTGDTTLYIPYLAMILIAFITIIRIRKKYI